MVTTEQSEFVSLAKDDFNALLKNNFEIAMVIIRGLVKRLREALAPAGCSRMVETIRGAGYRLTRSPEMASA